MFNTSWNLLSLELGDGSPPPFAFCPPFVAALHTRAIHPPLVFHPFLCVPFLLFFFRYDARRHLPMISLDFILCIASALTSLSVA